VVSLPPVSLPRPYSHDRRRNTNFYITSSRIQLLQHHAVLNHSAKDDITYCNNIFPKCDTPSSKITLSEFYNFYNCVKFYNNFIPIFMFKMKLKIVSMQTRSHQKKMLDTAYCTVGLKGINDQPGDGLEKKGRNM